MTPYRSAPWPKPPPKPKTSLAARLVNAFFLWLTLGCISLITGLTVSDIWDLLTTPTQAEIAACCPEFYDASVRPVSTAPVAPMPPPSPVAPIFVVLPPHH